MKAFRGVTLSVCVAATAAFLGGCGNALEGGSEPSGSYVRVVSVTPSPADSFTPDLYVSVCDATKDPPTYEPGLHNNYAQVQMLNESRRACR